MKTCFWTFSAVYVTVMFRLRPFVDVVTILVVCLVLFSRVTRPHVLWTPHDWIGRRLLCPSYILVFAVCD